MDTLMPHLRDALRLLRRAPGYVAMSVLTFGLGVGAVTAVYSVVDAVLVDPLPFEDADRVMRLWSAWPERGIDQGTVSPLDLEDWREQAGTLESIGGYSSLPLGGLVVTGDGPPVQLQTSYVTSGFFETLSVPALHGRTLVFDDHAEGNNQAVVLSHAAWQQHFGSDTTAVGRSFQASDGDFVLVGVMPPEFEFPHGGIEAWAPTSLIPPSGIPRERFVRWLAVVGRLADGVEIAGAEAELETIASRMATVYPDSNEDLTAVTIRPLRDVLLGSVRPALLALLAGVGLLLGIACANVASVAVARTERRAGEFSIRAALGASSRRLAWGLVLEMTFLALLGGALGLALGIWGGQVLSAMAPPDLPRLRGVGLDGGVLAVAIGCCLGAGMLAGLVPGLQTRRVELVRALRGSGAGRGVVGGGIQRKLLVVTQIALVTVLAIGGSLLLRSYQELLRVDPGFQVEGVLTLDVHAAGDDFSEFLHQALDRIRAVPGVDAAGMVRPFPLGPETFAGEGWTFTIPQAEGPRAGEELEADLRFASPGYFEAMGIPILDGRTFTDRDMPVSPEPSDDASGIVVVVSRSAAERFWPGDSPVGTLIRSGGSAVEVVGVVEDVRQTALDDMPEPAIYVPHRQVARRGMTIAVKGNNPTALAGPVQAAIWELRPDQPIRNVASLEEIVSRSLARPRFAATLFTVFTILALVLAAVGVYGAVSTFVSRQLREMGIRRALGARVGHVFRNVVARGVRLAGAGVAIGVILSLVATRSLGSLLFGVSPLDPWSFVGVSLLLVSLAVVAAVMPAVRACRVDPASVIRSE